MPKIKFLGSCREVGRSAITIESKNGEKILLDYGIRMSGEERLPQEIDDNNLKAVALTHCHIDHSGALPLIYKNNNVPFFTNPVSLSIIDVLIKDMIRISSYSYPFGYRDLKNLISEAHFLKNNTRQKITENLHITFIDAGHVPGSVSILVEIDDKTILYTGDINTISTQLINPAKPSNIPDLDALIIESTYALRDHPPREELELKFIEKIIEIVENDGTVIIPAFGVARSQEALLILQNYNYQGKIFIDGLARRVSRIYLEHPESLKNISAFRKALKRAHLISTRKNKNERAIAVNTSGVIISPSGMLKGGAVMEYLKYLLDDPHSAIYLVGYQTEGSPGRTLINEGTFIIKEEDRKKSYKREQELSAKCDVDYFDFSSHADRTHLYNYVEKLKFKSEATIFCVHGDNESCTTFASELVKKGYNSVAPEIGEIYKI